MAELGKMRPLPPAAPGRGGSTQRVWLARVPQGRRGRLEAARLNYPLIGGPYHLGWSRVLYLIQEKATLWETGANLQQSQ